MGGPGAQKTVYLVDDAADVLFLFRLMLEKGGYEVLGEAMTAEAAMAGAPALQPAVVLVDHLLPDQSGIELAGRLRAALPESHIIICSGSRDDEAVAQARAAGADGWLDKADVSRLVASLEEVLAGAGWAAKA